MGDNNNDIIIIISGSNTSDKCGGEIITITSPYNDSDNFGGGWVDDLGGYVNGWVFRVVGGCVG